MAMHSCTIAAYAIAIIVIFAALVLIALIAFTISLRRGKKANRNVTPFSVSARLTF